MVSIKFQDSTKDQRHCYDGATVGVSRRSRMTIDILLLRKRVYRKRIYVSERKCKRTRDILEQGNQKNSDIIRYLRVAKHSRQNCWRHYIVHCTTGKVPSFWEVVYETIVRKYIRNETRRLGRGLLQNSVNNFSFVNSILGPSMGNC
jgi:hypothetical protein